MPKRKSKKGCGRRASMLRQDAGGYETPHGSALFEILAGLKPAPHAMTRVASDLTAGGCS